MVTTQPAPPPRSSHARGASASPSLARVVWLAACVRTLARQTPHAPGVPQRGHSPSSTMASNPKKRTASHSHNAPRCACRATRRRWRAYSPAGCVRFANGTMARPTQRDACGYFLYRIQKTGKSKDTPHPCFFIRAFGWVGKVLKKPHAKWCQNEDTTQPFLVQVSIWCPKLLTPA